MKSRINTCLFIIALFFLIVFSSCVNSRNHNISVNKSLSIFLLNNGNDYFFCIPIQYIGDYHIGNFDFDIGLISIGDFDISLKREEINIYIYLNETSDENGNTDGEYNLIYSEENNKVLISKMNEPLSIKHESNYMMNQYNIFIERYLTKNEMENIFKEYKNGNVYSHLEIWFNITIDDEEQVKSGMIDDFELHNEFVQEVIWILPHFELFITKYLE